MSTFTVYIRAEYNTPVVGECLRAQLESRLLETTKRYNDLKEDE